jgi:hypothetical protein
LYSRSVFVLLEKYLGWLTGTGLLILFSVILFPQGFQFVVNWLGPVVGQNLTPILMIVYILLASAIKYPTILLTYIVSGFACGALGRGGVKRSILLALLAFLTLFLLLGANIYPMIRTFSSFSATSMPSMPPGASLTDLLSLPLVSDYASTALQSLFGGGQGGGGMMGGSQTILLQIGLMLLTSLLINFAVLCVSSVIGGLTTSKLIPRLRRGKTPVPGPNLNTRVLAFSILSLLLFSQIPVATCNMVKNVNSATTGTLVTQDMNELFGMANGEFLMGQISNDGSLSFIYAYAGFDLATMGITLSASDLQGIMFAGFAVRSGDVTGLPDQFQQLLTYVPSQGFFVLSSGGGDVEAQSRRITSQFEVALGISFGEPSVLQVPMGDQQFNIVMYNVATGTTVETGYNAFHSLLPTGGLSHFLTPDSVSSRPFIALLGVMNPEVMGGGGGSKNGTSGGNVGTISFAVNFVAWNQTYAGTSLFDFSLKQTLGFTGAISSNLPNGSYIAVTLPPTIEMDSLTVDPNSAVAEGSTVMLMVNPGDSYADLRISFRARFPPNVVVTKTISPSVTNAGGTVTVTVEVHNLGDTAINNVDVDDSDTVGTYQLSADVVSGSTSGHWTQLSPGETRTVTYSVRVSANGIYTLEPATVTYSDEYGDYTKTSEREVVT